jgi:hypothetical protein
MTTASTRQPTATRPLFRFDEYEGSSGKALSVRVSLRDMARFYAEDPRQAGGYEDTWRTCDGSPYLPRAIHNADEALDAVASFSFPAGLRAAAQRAARHLTHTFTPLTRLAEQRDLPAGRLDRRKLPALAQATARGDTDVSGLRPYRRLSPTPATLPTVAIVASAGNAEMWHDADYIPRVLTLTLGVLWACQAVGLPACAALTQGHCDLLPRGYYREAVAGWMLATPDEIIPLQAYAVALHRDLWRYGIMSVQAADYESNRRLMALRGRRAGKTSIGYGWPSYHGGAAATWARQVLGADVVIGLGRITDTPDIHLPTACTLEEAVARIARQAETLLTE